MGDDIVTRLSCIYVAHGCGECTFCLAKAEIQRLTAEVNDLRLQVVTLSTPRSVGN